MPHTAWRRSAAHRAPARAEGHCLPCVSAGGTEAVKVRSGTACVGSLGPGVLRFFGPSGISGISRHLLPIIV